MTKAIWVINVPRWFHPENHMKAVAFDLRLSIKIDIDKRLLRKEVYIEVEGSQQSVNAFGDTVQAYLDAN